MSHSEIIAHTMRDIFLNDLIYVSIVDNWKQYENESKTWKNFITSDFKSKLSKLQIFFDEDLLKYLLYQKNITDTEKFYLKRELQCLSKCIHNDEITDEILIICKNLFCIGI